MPEITEIPPLAPLIQNNPKLGDTVLSVSEDQAKYEDIRFRIDHLMNEIKTGYPGLHPNAFRAITQLIAGPWLLPQQSHEERLQMEEDKELSARMQHEFVHHIFHATTKDATAAYRQNIYFMIAAMERNANSVQGEQHLLRSFLSGVKSELAVARTLTANGYRVILPDYIKRTDPLKGKYSQTLEWDVRSGVDLIATRPNGTVYLIDTKGRLYSDKSDANGNRVIKKDVTIDDRVTLQGMTFLPQSLSSTVGALQEEAGHTQSPVKRARIIIPTSASSLGWLGTKKDSRSYGEAVDKFALLKPNLQTDIINGLSNDA